MAIQYMSQDIFLLTIHVNHVVLHANVAIESQTKIHRTVDKLYNYDKCLESVR